MTWVWTLWLLAFVGSFAVLEGWAIVHQDLTLSAWVWALSKAWPPFPAVFGLVIGGLIVHFFWTGQGPRQELHW
jgi:hypothetical protein